MALLSTCIDLAILAALAIVATEFRALRKTLESPLPSAPMESPGLGAAIADAVTSPALPPLLTDELEADLEKEEHDTAGAQSGHVVCAYWAEQDERDWFDEECSKRSDN